MPRKELDYSKTNFYKLVCKDLSISDCYVGHTLNFKNRKSEHKRSCINQGDKNHHLNVYQFIRENGSWENWDMILIETVKCDNGLEARKKEREHIEKEGATLNKARPYVSRQDIQEYKKQWDIDNEEKMKQSKTKYYENNRDVVIQRSKDRYIEKKDEILEYIRNYNKENREYRLQKQKERYILKKDEYLSKQYEPIQCQCGAICMKQNMLRHKQTKKHQDYINSLQD